MKIKKCMKIIGILIVCVLIFIVTGKLESIYDYKILLVIYYCCIGFIYAFCLWIILYMLEITGFHNIKYCDDSLFCKIDILQLGANDSDEYYAWQIKCIDYYYQQDGEVDKLIEKGEIQRLYKRLDFLTVEYKLYDEFTMILMTIALSLAASAIGFYCGIASGENVVVNPLESSVIIFVLIIVAVIGLLLLLHARRGNLDLICIWYMNMKLNY